MTQGLYSKYVGLCKANGEPVTEDYFVLIPDRDKHAEVALRAYALSCYDENPVLAQDIFDWVGYPEDTKVKCLTCAGTGLDPHEQEYYCPECGGAGIIDL